MLQNKHFLTTLLIGFMWGIVLLIVGFNSWEAGLPGSVTSSGDAFGLGVAFGLAALLVTYILLRRTFPTESVRSVRWRKMANLMDEMDERDLDLLRQQLARPRDDFHDEETLTVEELLQDQKQKRGQTSQRF